jgi:hypothetical protein
MIKIMKKVYLAVIFSFFLFLFNPLNKNVFAVCEDEGTFECKWATVAVGDNCQLDTYQCKKNYVPDESVCNALASNTCVQSNPHCCVLLKDVICGENEDCQKDDGTPLCSCSEGTKCTEETIREGMGGAIRVRYRCQAKEEEEKEITLLQPKCCDITTGEEISCTASSFSGEENPNKGIQTALGCFPTQPSAIIQWILKYAIMAAGSIGFLLMLYASFQMMTSAGDPEKLKAGQQLLSSAIIGILLIVFSLFILKFIGADILKIPGWE